MPLEEYADSIPLQTDRVQTISTPDENGVPVVTFEKYDVYIKEDGVRALAPTITVSMELVADKESNTTQCQQFFIMQKSVQ